MKILNKLNLFIVFLIFTGSCKESSKKEPTPEKSPNIIVIVTDDQGYGDIGCHGNAVIKTPNLDNFASQSLELTNFHVGTTCAPTRAGLMTGRNANRNNAWHTISGCSILLEDEETIAEVFKKNQYETAMFGKWHLGDNYPFRPEDRGFKTTFNLMGGGINQTPDYWNNTYFEDTYYRNSKPEKVKGYCTDVWFNEAIEYIDKSKEKPFFMYLALNAAHSPFNVPEKYAEMYSDAPLSDIQKRFYGMITNIDENFGKLVAHLKKEGVYDNTILVFTTDNGTAAGITKGKNKEPNTGYNAGLKGTKASHYDGGHRVPFFISWPNGNILQGEKINDLAAHVDMLPTLTEMAGISFNEKKPLDGTSIAGLLTGKEKAIDRMLVVDTQRNQLPEKGRNSCVMSTEWRLVNGKELYNTIKDPGQKEDISNAHPEKVKEMQAFYDKWWKTIVPDVRYAEIPLGDKAANPVLITVHDMHTKDPIPWNQVQIREAKFFPKGYYSVNIKASGKYRIKMFRYPPESGLALNATTPAIDGGTYTTTLPKGTIINPIKARISIGKTTLNKDVDPTQPSVVLEGKFTIGSNKLESYFIDEKGKEISAYYTLIEKI
ncbi:arylsulfatase [uncultured Maribacter sp.]|uniref:arylsulfatase n=1 Tax=uncultured Maribacter sp. TaxID=431308 RepID=UPI00261E583A|nr:arylsulfatase [uncultured Maribacter sp.]